MSAENSGTGQLSCNWVLGIRKGYRTMQNCPVPLFSPVPASKKMVKSPPSPVEPEGSKLKALKLEIEV